MLWLIFSIKMLGLSWKIQNIIPDENGI